MIAASDGLAPTPTPPEPCRGCQDAIDLAQTCLMVRSRRTGALVAMCLECRDRREAEAAAGGR